MIIIVLLIVLNALESHQVLKNCRPAELYNLQHKQNEKKVRLAIANANEYIPIEKAQTQILDYEASIRNQVRN